jgi:ribosomal protein L40E
MKSNYDKAVEIYNQGGQYAVYDAVEAGILKADSMRDCTPCEARTPHEGDDCLVCGTQNLRQPESENQALDHTIRFERATDCFLWLEENDIHNPVTLTIHLGE